MAQQLSEDFPAPTLGLWWEPMFQRDPRESHKSTKVFHTLDLWLPLFPLAPLPKWRSVIWSNWWRFRVSHPWPREAELQAICKDAPACFKKECSLAIGAHKLQTDPGFKLYFRLPWVVWPWADYLASPKPLLARLNQVLWEDLLQKICEY